MVLDFPMNLEKTNPKSRRFSTGNDIKPLHLPNYLRASIGSRHDFCKYGARGHVSPESIGTKHDKALGKKKVPVPSSRQQPSELSPKPLVRGDQSSLKQPNNPLLRRTKSAHTCHDHAGKGTKYVPLTCSSVPRPSGKESLFRRFDKNANSLEKDTHLEIKKSVGNSETCQNTSSGKESLSRRSGKNVNSREKDTQLEIKKSIENSETRQNTSSGKENLFRRSSKNASSLEKDTHLKIKKSVENSESCQDTRYEIVPEKIIHVVEPNNEIRDKDLAPNRCRCGGLVLSPNQKQKLDSEAKSRSSGARISKSRSSGARISNVVLVPKESDSSSRKLKSIKNGKALEIENVEADFKGKSLRRVVSDAKTSDLEQNVSMLGALRHEEITQKTAYPELMNAVIEETAGKLTSKSKVKVLVDAFETLITFQDFECPSPCRLSV